MLHKQLARYLGTIENAVVALDGAYVEHYEEEMLTPERANLRFRIRFAARHMLEVNEAMII